MSMPDWLFLAEVLCFILLFSVWSRFREINIFAFSQAIPVPVFVLVMLLLVQGWVGSGIGAFAVVWKDPADTADIVLMWKYSIFWNGFALSLYFLVLAYLVYLLYALAYPEKKNLEDRLAVVACLAVPSLLVINLPVLWDPVPRWFFTIGSILALLVFGGFARALTHFGNKMVLRAKELKSRVPVELASDAKAKGESPIKTAFDRWFKWFVDRRVRGKYVLERQADGLFGLALVAVSGMVGFTFCNYENWTDILWKWLPTTALAVLATAAWYGIRRCAVERYKSKLKADAPLPNDASESREGRGLVFASYVASAVFWASVGITLGYILALAIGFLFDVPNVVIPAPLSFSFVLGAIAVAYGLLRFYAGRWFYPALIVGAAIFLTIASVRPYSHEIEELEPYYARGKPVKLADYEKLRNDPGAKANQLDNATVLGKWRRGVSDHHLSQKTERRSALEIDPETHRPPLVIVTTAGGASVSAIYTQRFLAKLEAEEMMPGFHRHIRIITGASGGMFGASAYRASLRADSSPVEAKWGSGLEEDFFSPAVQSMAFKDIPMGLSWPLGYSNDRGRRLERSWDKALPKQWGVNFRDMKGEEAEGLLPSLIFSPMLVEDGRPLLISTLDLALMTRGRAYQDSKGRTLYKPAKPMESADEDGETLRDPTPSVEFFKLFPDETGWNLRLGTAARLSASFPYLSPATTLPTNPPRRIVDAGYLDNFGMAVALGWLRDYIDQVDLATDRVIVLEIRPYGSTFNPKSIVTKEEIVRGGRVPTFGWPLQEWTTPLEGGETARRAGMVGRNNLNRDLFSDLQQESDVPSRLEEEIERGWRAGQKGFETPFAISSIRFKGNLESSLNWTLSKHEIADVHAAVDEIFLAENEIMGKYGLTETDKFDSAMYLRWRHNNAQYEVFRELMKDYFPIKRVPVAN